MKREDMLAACITGDVHHHRNSEWQKKDYMFAEEYAKILDKERISGKM